MVVLNGNATGGEIERLKALGACTYVTKPFQVPNLLQVIDKALAENSRRTPYRNRPRNRSPLNLQIEDEDEGGNE